ncbi:cilia- and flagella-associated protein 57-like [Teleopsis dalmanni]|uniref:cilia- and flagella-associated protein 57-like n=1 Tax=Teleopsis dalmanni TaxID=139649 RepID=UPI0018CFBFFA|nr:cilia- and flagella-associated protein 57-like [Teleopsis dalmanni]
MTMASSKKFLAVLEQNPTDGSYISVYDMSTLKKRRHLVLPEKFQEIEINAMLFTYDARAIVLMTKCAEASLLMLTLDKSSSEAECTLPSTDNDQGYECMACHPEDNALVAIAGTGVLIFLCKAETTITVSSTCKFAYNICSMYFLASDLLLMGSDDNDLILVENGDFKTHQKANTAESVHILKDQEQMDKELAKMLPSDEVLKDKRVTFVTNLRDAFVFVLFNRVFVFEKETKFEYVRTTVITLRPSEFPEEAYQIKNIAFDDVMENIIVSPTISQIYTSRLSMTEDEFYMIEDDEEKEEEEEATSYMQLYFKPLGQKLHVDGIVDVSICSWKPIVVTASKDQTVRIWNYETDEIELVRKFQVDVNLVELCCTGFMVAIGFADQLRLAQIYMEDLDIVKTFNFPRCTIVRFSNLGAYMAAGYDNCISVITALNFETVIHLKGHSGIILTLAWTKMDDTIVSGGAEGAIYQWDVHTGERLQEIVQKGTQYNTVCIGGTDPISIYAITNYGVVREFQNSELVREIALPTEMKAPLIDMCLSRSDMVMFVSNTLNDLINIHCPFSEAGGGRCRSFRFFASPIKRLKFTFDGLMLITASDAGTLGFWVLENIEGRIAIMDKDLLRCQEILIPRSILHDKIEQVKNLNLRLKQQAEEFAYQLSQNQLFDGQQLAAVHKSYCDAMEQLRALNNQSAQLHVEDMNAVTFKMTEVINEHNRKLKNLENQYGEQMLMEYQKFSNLRETMLKVRKGYEEKLQKSASTLQNTVEGLEEGYKMQLNERRELLRELIKEMQNKKAEYFEYCRQVDIESQRTLHDTKMSYENKLQDEKNSAQLWRGRAGVYRKKYELVGIEIENLLEELEILTEENTKSEKIINKGMRDIDDLQKDIADRDYVISTKEKRIQELFHRNQELDKYKLVLLHRITELKAQIEPKEYLLNDKRKKIIDMENALEDLNQANIRLEAEIESVKGKYYDTIEELRNERNRAKAARERINNMRTEIYQLGAKINFPKQMRKIVQDMYKKYVNKEPIKRSINMDKLVREEYFRQRNYIENKIKNDKEKSKHNVVKEECDAIFNENMELMREIDKLRAENNAMKEKALKKQKARNEAKLKGAKKKAVKK